MSGGDVRKVSRQDIQLVQNLIERCLQLYMNQKEVVDTLLYQAKIEPGFTELVWQKLEEENREFFKAYHVRLMLKNQILVFNKLLEKQIEIMHKSLSPGVTSVPHSNGSGSSTLHQTPPSYLSDHASTSSRPDTLFSNGGSPISMMNGSSSGNQSIQLHNGASILVGSSQNSHTQRPNGMNGTAIKSEPSYSDNSDFPFCNDGSFLDTQVPIESSSELNGQPLNESLMDNDTSSYVFLSQIPPSFSFSDLTADFTQSADILQNYGRSPYLGAEPHNFSDSPRREYEEEDRRLDTISEGVSFDDFGSD